MKTHQQDIADIVCQFFQEYRTQFGDKMLPSPKKAMVDIATCQTVARGGRQLTCEDCEHSFWVYFGYRNRSCPAVLSF
jgi:hypothetical protein